MSERFRQGGLHTCILRLHKRHSFNAVRLLCDTYLLSHSEDVTSLEVRLFFTDVLDVAQLEGGRLPLALERDWSRGASFTRVNKRLRGFGLLLIVDEGT